MTRFRSVSLLLFVCYFAPFTSAQTLKQEIIDEIRRGPAETQLNSEIVRVPIVGQKTLPLLDVTINGKGPFRLLIDFGANVILLQEPVYRKCGGIMIADRENNDIVRLQEMKIGEANFFNVVAGVTDNLDVDGVLGFNFFRDLLVTLDYPRMMLTLQHGALPAADGKEILTYELESRMPFLRVAAGDSSMLLNFDTGATDWIVLPTSAKKDVPLQALPVPGPITWNNQTGENRVEIARMKEDLLIGRYTVKSPRVHFDPAVDSGFFGSSLLQFFVLTFDLKNKLVRLQKEGADVIEVPRFRTFGFRLRQSESGWEISDVIPGTPAARSGIKNGDRVLSINKANITENWKMISEKEDTLELEVLRDGKKLHFKLNVVILG